MGPGQDLARKRTRESTSKVRTGCSTCKARRVKCDEAKPICQRCAVGDRHCEYNTARFAPPPRNVITVYLPPAQSQPAFFMKDRGLDFFHQNLATELDGQFDSNFWSKLVLQLAHSESSVRHAVSAISVSYQDVESSLRHPAGYVNANPEAQRVERSSEEPLRSNSSASQLEPGALGLLPSVHLYRIPQGNVESSLFHVESGLNILAALRQNDNVPADPRSNLPPDDLKAVEDYIVPVFSRLSLLCSLAGRSAPPICVSTGAENSVQEDFSDSRRRLVEVSDTCLRFIGKASLKAAVFQIDGDDLVGQVQLQTRLDAWRDDLDELVQRTQAAGKPAKQDPLNLLLIQYKVLYIWLRVCTAAGETATDSYPPDFDELVHYAEQIATSDLRLQTPQPLSFEMQILAPLYYTALKCRHPAIRRRAVELLQFAPRREALWNAHYAYVTAKRVIELEERHLNGQGFARRDFEGAWSPLPDDTKRIYNLGMVPIDGLRRSAHSFVPSPACPGTVEAVFRTKPWGLLGSGR